MPTKIPQVEIRCEYCSKSKMVHTWQLRQGNARFCSKRCGYDSHVTKVSKTCLTCGKVFSVKKNREESAKYCSLKCYDKFSKNNPFYNQNHTLEKKKLMSAIKQGIEVDDWKFFTSIERARVMGTAQYRRWRESVLDRDNYMCVWCGATEQLNADHIKSYALHPDLRFELTNGRTLCVPCHQKTASYLNSMGRNQWTK